MQETSRVATFEKDNRVAAKWKEGHRGDAGLRQFIDKRSSTRREIIILLHADNLGDAVRLRDAERIQ